MAIALSELLDEKQVILRLRSRKLPNALREIIQVLAQNGKIDDAETFLEQVLAREQAHPSVVENGVAFPHARTDLVDEIVIGIGRSRAGIPIGADQQRARLIFVIGVPERLLNDYLICVGTLARLVKNDAITLEAAPSRDASRIHRRTHSAPVAGAALSAVAMAKADDPRRHRRRPALQLHGDALAFYFTCSSNRQFAAAISPDRERNE